MGYYQKTQCQTKVGEPVPGSSRFECSIGVMAGNVLDAEILCVAYHGTAEDPQKRCFFTAGNDAVIRAWNIMSQGLQCELKGHKDSVTCLSLDANFLFSGSDDKSIRMWNVTNITDAYEVTCFENAHSRPIRDLILDNLGFWFLARLMAC